MLMRLSSISGTTWLSLLFVYSDLKTFGGGSDPFWSCSKFGTTVLTLLFAYSDYKTFGASDPFWSTYVTFKSTKSSLILYIDKSL